MTVTLEQLSTPRRFPKGAYRGELVGANGRGCLGFLYVVAGRVYVGLPVEYGHGEVDRLSPITFDPKQFERAGSLRLSAAQSVKFWKFVAAAAPVSASEER